MQEPIKQLLSLQERDLEMDRIQSELAAIPREIQSLRNLMEAEKKTLEDSKKEWMQLQLQRKEKEIDLETKEGEIRKHAGELNNLKSNDAYRAMVGEIEKVKKEKSALEDTILLLMDKGDQAQRSWKEREAAAKAAEGDRQRQISEWEFKRINLEELIAQKQKERETLAAEYPPRLLESYQRLRKGPGAVIVPIRAEQCAGCHMRVSHNLVNEVKRGQSINFCEHCQRIVYLEEVPAQ